MDPTDCSLTLRQRFSQSAAHPGISVGIACGFISAVFYTLSNIALRQSVSVDSFFVAAMKSGPTIVFLTPYLLAMKWTGRRVAVSPHLIPRFMLVSLIGQVGGNGSFQFALGKIGLAATVPITLGSLLIASAVLGRWILGESVQRRTAIAITILIAAVFLLSQSGETPLTGIAGDALRWEQFSGAMFAVGSGVSFAIFSTTMRLSMQQGLQSATAMWISGMVGTTALLAIAFSRIGLESLDGLTVGLWQSMIFAGVFNFVAFVAITTAMRVLPIVAVHLLNASQVAMAATAGVILFSEPTTWKLISGIVLTMAGLMVLATRRPLKTSKEPIR
ncbi:DMT family transporter [Neorhodopirellula pilleata]|uniref:EamA-like transporter family protein n=1 Tax=Neorhodopirellula pilleata TaxID=2714738 RepID=A0A5C6ATZ9_9BACT|nr:DMT family transporter [Neorhodopirellula pilleata]TWU03210.1 EamA-like transporter family protein [Neorhodopirellula pilleata]